jgi:triacylglycerol lipase
MITFLLSVILAVTLLLALLTYTLFCYEESNQSGKPLGPFLALAAKTTLRSIASEILILILHPVGLWPRLWKEPTEGKALVILVHGLFHNQSAWVLFRRWLHARGFGAACLSYASWGSAVGRNGGRRARRHKKPARQTSGSGRAPGRTQHGRPLVVVGPGAA